PDRSAGVFSLGPRVLIAADDLGATGLVQPGSRVRHRTLLRLPAGEEPEVLRERLTSLLPDPALRITTFRQAQPGLRRFWEQLTLYLGLTGLVALLVGGIGVASSVTAFIRERLQTIAILKCLGAGWRQVLGIYLAQAVVLGLAGGTLGAALGTGLQTLLAPFLSALLPFEVESVVSSGAVLRGIAMGLGVTLLWPVVTRHTAVDRVNLHRLRANAIEAAQQCGALSVPEVREAVPLQRAFADWPKNRRLYLCAEKGKAAPLGEAAQRHPADAPAAILTGPEGGFHQAELDALALLPFVTPVALGPLV
ncbi:MAG: 16S rRNA (uracil(1498)-N(3))-methyltransferase, partial [candidate division NC10 bacterium]